MEEVKIVSIEKSIKLSRIIIGLLLVLAALDLSILYSHFKWKASIPVQTGINEHVKVVYQINDATIAKEALRSIRNHVDADKTAEIAVVAYGKGVDFLMAGAADDKGQLYEYTLDELRAAGVKFEVCENTLRNRSLRKEQFIGSAQFTRSGVARLAELQKKGFGYLRP